MCPLGCDRGCCGRCFGEGRGRPRHPGSWRQSACRGRPAGARESGQACATGLRAHALPHTLLHTCPCTHTLHTCSCIHTLHIPLHTHPTHTSLHMPLHTPLHTWPCTHTLHTIPYTHTPTHTPAQIHFHRVGDAIQPSHPLSSPSPPAPNPSQHQSLFQ